MIPVWLPSSKIPFEHIEWKQYLCHEMQNEIYQSTLKGSFRDAHSKVWHPISICDIYQLLWFAKIVVIYEFANMLRWKNLKFFALNDSILLASFSKYFRTKGLLSCYS